MSDSDIEVVPFSELTEEQKKNRLDLAASLGAAITEED